MSSFQLYTIFHLNIAYSSIEEDKRPEVIRRCYWPLLRLARQNNLPIGIEASGYTLETVARLDPAWLDELQRLTSEGICEFIGSGYSQVIGPLVPAGVNAANFRLGHEAYERLLGFRPMVAMVNEQTYSAGMVRHYLDAGYQAIIMEWNNPARYHPEWKSEWRNLPQLACGPDGETIALIWNDAIAFQKFQRYAYGEIELDEYLDYLRVHMMQGPGTFPLYGNDIEIFDFRPGRYHTEPDMNGENEWERISMLFKALLSDEGFQIVLPRQVLDLMSIPASGNRLYLESPEQPIAVKKQEKYNITRWAVTGRDDLGINTACWRIYDVLKRNSIVDDDAWRELCYLWSSDFRTHITETRWKAYRERLDDFGKKIKTSVTQKPAAEVTWPDIHAGLKASDDLCSHVESDGHYLSVETEGIRVRLNCRRGMAIDGLWFKSVSDQPLVGTLQHGYYDDISMGADYYTGHMVFESPGQPKVTDLSPIEPEVDKNEDWTRISGTVSTPMGPVHKSICVFHDLARVDLEYRLDWEVIPLGSLRLGHVTLNPAVFDHDTLFYLTHNGGKAAEKFFLTETNIDHGAVVSFLVSAKQGIGMSDGVVQIGDARNILCIKVDKRAAALIGLITFRQIDDTYFLRLALSMKEMDETSRQTVRKAEEETPTIRFSLTV